MLPRRDQNLAPAYTNDWNESTATLIATEQVKAGAPWAIVAVMGVTGTGKSTFIRTVSGDASVGIGNSLESCTSMLQGYSFHYNGFNVSLVDTPGFNDTFRSETEVLQDISSWLREQYESETKLAGILYLHGINHSRVEGSALRNLKMFRELCGREALKNIVLATTFWDTVDRRVGDAREAELADKEAFWGEMLARGSRMARFVDRESGLDILSSLIGLTPTPLKIQRELVEEDIALVDTGAGRMVNKELARLEEKHRQELVRLKADMDDAMREQDAEFQEVLRVQEERVEARMDKIHRQQEQLRADRRAEARRMQSELQKVTIERDQLKAYNEKANKEYEGLSIDEIVARVRAKESKLGAKEREKLEEGIQKAKKEGSTKKRGKAVSVFFYVLRLAVPVATLLTLGIPIAVPGLSSETDPGAEPSLE